MNILCFASKAATFIAKTKLSESDLINTGVLLNSDRIVPVA
jgi:hypothetical protein